MADSVNEKRQHPRLELKAPAKFRVPTARMDIGMASIKNISGGGLCVLTNTKIKKGQVIQMEFGLPADKTTILALGEIVWVTDMDELDTKFKYQLGVKFVEIEKEKQKNINRFVITRLKARVREELDKLPTSKTATRRSILVIDDDKVTRELISTVFSDDFNVLTAADGYEGVEMAKNWRPDLILLDIVMPIMDGFSTLMILKDFGETKDIPVLMLSVLHDKSKIFQAIRGGAQDYILKPFTPENLIVKINKIIHTKQRSHHAE